MLSERDIEAAHPDAFDFVFGNLPSTRQDDFRRHLTGCRVSRAVVEEYREIGGLIKRLPPHVDPPAELEDRIVDAMVAVLAEPEARFPPVAPVTSGPPAPAGAEPPASPPAARLPVRRRPRGRLAALAALAVIAAAVIAAVLIALVVLPHLRGDTQATVTVQLHATTADRLAGDGAATGRATARQSGSGWTFQLTVRGLKVLAGTDDVYACWWVGPSSTQAHPRLVSGGTFVVTGSGSATVTMTTGINPRQFRTMEVTAKSPGTGAMTGAVLLAS